KEFLPEREATIVTKMKKAGAVIVGKTTMGEFAAGYLGSAFGIARNAYDPRRSPSGSSSGTGSGIAANFATVGIGEDTGGSVRGPAPGVGVGGLGAAVPFVRRHGVMPGAPTSETLGRLAPPC